MATSTLIPAAQYLRMSTENQQYSLENQAAAIDLYAKENGFKIVETYSDAARSGVVLRHRAGLVQLLQDVVSAEVGFQAILVYDVSRWGRFQDTDEAAHYEFLCKSAGVPIYYCAEQFNNDGSVSSLILKSLKRAMAAEFSRELGVKIYAGQKRLAQLGFRMGAKPGYGLRRMMVSAEGLRKSQMKTGEYKNYKSDRVILVPGPKNEVAVVRLIYAWALAGMKPVAITQKLNEPSPCSTTGLPCIGGLLQADSWELVGEVYVQPVVALSN